MASGASLRGGSAAKFVIGGVVLAAAIAGAIIFVAQGHSAGPVAPSGATNDSPSLASGTRPAAVVEPAPGTAAPAPPPAPVPPAAGAPRESASAPPAERHDVVSRAAGVAHHSHAHGSPKAQTETPGPKARTKVQNGANQAPIID